MHKHYEAQVIEDNAGGLHMYVFDRKGIDGGHVIWCGTGYEYTPGHLSQDMRALLNGEDPRSDWDSGDAKPQGLYDGQTSYEHGWEIVGQVADGKITLYPRRMGRAAQIEFDLTDEQIDTGKPVQM